MLVVPESVNNAEGDDDKIYLFFTEEAIDIDFPGKVRVSRVARVCKVCSYHMTFGFFIALNTVYPAVPAQFVCRASCMCTIRSHGRSTTVVFSLIKQI